MLLSNPVSQNRQTQVHTAAATCRTQIRTLNKMNDFNCVFDKHEFWRVWLILFLLVLSVVLKVWILKSKQWSWGERRSGYRSGEWRGSAVSLSLTQPAMSLPVSQKHMRSSRSAQSHSFQSGVSETQPNIFHVELLRFNQLCLLTVNQPLTNTEALSILNSQLDLKLCQKAVIKALP